MTQTYAVDRLDADTLSYLKRVAAADGKRMPGVYQGTTNYWPVIGLILGFILIGATVLGTFPPTEEPAKEALLQTAGFLLGGWMIVAAFRIWSGAAAGKRLGKFIYADPLNLYQVSGSGVAVTDLTDIQEAKATQNFNEGKYQNTHIEMSLGKRSKAFTLYSERTGRQMAVFLNALAYMRGGGEDGTDEQLKTLAPEQMAGIAKHIAATGSFPRSMTDVDETDAVDIPSPRADTGGGGGGFVWYLLIIAAGAALFFGFRTMNKSLREDVIYARIMELQPKDQPPALRMYLSHPDFKNHRAEAEAKLESAYRTAAAQMVQGKNPEFAEAMRMSILGLAKKPQPVISLRVEEEGAAAGNVQVKQREDTTARELADKWGSTIGDELVIFAQLDDKAIKPMIHVAYRMAGAAVQYTVTFRHGPDDPPYKTVSGAYNAVLGPNPFGVPGFADHIMGESCGLTRQRPFVFPDADF